MPHPSMDALLSSQLIKIFRNITVRKPHAPFPSPLHCLTRVLTLAEITAMHTTPLQILPNLPNVNIRPVNLIITGSGTFTNFTSFILQDAAGTPVVIATLTLAAINAGMSLLATSGVTLGAGFQTNLTKGKGIVAKTSGGTAADAGTSITVSLFYAINE